MISIGVNQLGRKCGVLVEAMEDKSCMNLLKVLGLFTEIKDGSVDSERPDLV